MCVAHEAENRAEALDDIRFARLAEQWPSQVRRARELDNRPCLTINRLPAFIRQVVNDARQNRPAIKVHPADDAADPQVARMLKSRIEFIREKLMPDFADFIGGVNRSPEGLDEQA